MKGTLECCDPLNTRQFEIAVRRLADSLSYGTDHSAFVGSGIEFVQSRLYEPGDPIKSIDWRVTARTGRVHVKEYESPKRMPVYMLLDTSASMMTGTAKLSKYAWAVQIAGGIAMACLDRISPVGIMAVGERELRLKPSLSRVQIMRWLYLLRHFSYDEQTHLGNGLRQLLPSLTERTMLFVLSDLHDVDALSALKLAGQLHDTVVIQLRDPSELVLSGSGFFRGREAESDRDFVSRGRGEWMDHEAMAAQLRRGGLDHLVLDTDAPIAPRLRQFLEARGGLGSRAR